MNNSCSVLNKSLIDEELLYNDFTSGEKTNIAHQKTAFVGAPTCIQLSKVYKTIYLVNRTGSNIPFCGGGYFLDVEGNVKNYLSANYAMTISLSNQGYWQQIINDSGSLNEIANAKINTPTVEITLSGTLDRVIKADVIISQTIDNQLVAVGDGLYVPEPPADVANDKIDTDAITINLSGTLDRTIEAELNVSQSAGNQISVLADGVYVPTPVIPEGAFTGDI